MFIPSLGFEKFSCSSEIQFFFLLLLHLRLFDDVRSKYSQMFVVFLFSQRSNSFLIWQFHFFHDNDGDKFHFYIVTVYS